MIASKTHVHWRAQDSGKQRLDHFPELGNDDRFSYICAGIQREKTSAATAITLVTEEEKNRRVVRPCVLWTSALSSLLSLLRIATSTTTEKKQKKRERLSKSGESGQLSANDSTRSGERRQHLTVKEGKKKEREMGKRVVVVMVVKRGRGRKSANVSVLSSRQIRRSTTTDTRPQRRVQ